MIATFGVAVVNIHFEFQPMRPGFEPRYRHHMWVSQEISPVSYSGCLLSTKNKAFYFHGQFNLELTNTFNQFFRVPKFFVGKQTTKHLTNFPFDRGTQRLFSAKYLFGEAKIA